MKKSVLWMAAMCLITPVSVAQHTIRLTVDNPSKEVREQTPVIYQLKEKVSSALVTENGKEIACQLDDIDGDGQYDELCFLTTLDKKQRKTFLIELSDSGTPRKYDPQVYVEMMLTNKKIKESNKQDLYISQLKVDRNVNPYWMIHHHGAAFESEINAYRIYFDHRQTVDIYGKYKKGLELKDTQFYPDQQQKEAGYGDDVLWVGETLGLGTLRGWDGSKPTMVKDVEHRSQRIVSRGPLRTIVEVKDEAWIPQPGQEPIDMKLYFTLYAGHRDCTVEAVFSKPANDYLFATGFINVKNSTEYSDRNGLRGCWGTDWPVSEKDSAGHKRETVGLGICIPTENIVTEAPADKDNYPFVIKTPTTQLQYHIVFASDNESFGMHSADAWFDYLRKWKKQLENPVKISVITK
jgi:hypothetical protein